MANRDVGLYHKYLVRRRDGKDLKGGFCIVLEVGDPNAWPALEVWIKTMRDDRREKLANEMAVVLSRAKNEVEA